MYAKNTASVRRRLNELIVPHAQYEDSLKALQQLYDARVEDNYIDGFCLTGKSGAGKTVIRKQFIAKYPPYETEDRTVRPIVKVVMPTSGGGKALLQKIAEDLGAPAMGTEASLETRLNKLLPACGTKLLVVDEAQHLVNMNGRTTIQRRAADTIKNLMSNAEISVALFGTEDLERIFLSNGQLRRRFSTMRTLRAWDPTDPRDLREVSKVLVTLLKTASIEFDDASLLNTEFVTQFAFATGGRMSYIVKLLIAAAHLAESGKLTARHFEDAFTQAVWVRATPVTNPFNNDFDRNLLNRAGQPFAEDQL